MTLRHPITSMSLALLGGLAVATAASAVSVGGRPFYAVLTGEAEINPEGDTDGAGTARVTINPGKNEVCWTLTWENIVAPAAAHIHVGDVNSEGGPVVLLDPIASGCRLVDPAVVNAILADPAGYYVNIHNADFPDGAIRGQLSSKKSK